MTIERVLALAQKANLRTEMEVFLAQLLGCNRLDLIARSDEEVPVEHLAELQKGWIRLQDGVPVAYLTQQKEFYGLNFYVDERVLVPRPETEQLVDLVLKHAKKSVLELGTGSGAIACGVKKSRPNLRVMATDLSKAALEVANKNCVQLGAKVELLQSDLLESVPQEAFEVLVANLPYIGTVRHALIAENVAKHEPAMALDGGEDGLELYRRLFEQIRHQNRSFLFILGEIGFSQGPDIRKLCEDSLPDYTFSLLQDLQGLDRHFVLERRPL
jgi:release factor glutamine methyltransferase